LLVYLRIKTEMGHEVWVLESVMMMIRYYDECFGGDLFNEAFGSSYGRAPNHRRISEKLTANNGEEFGRGLN
jgi:hypothetical protein